jgi:hypothetical protein
MKAQNCISLGPRGQGQYVPLNHYYLSTLCHSAQGDTINFKCHETVKFSNYICM